MESSRSRFCIVLGQRLPWPEMLARARETEALGFEGLFLVDHFYGLCDLDAPTHEAYTMLAALAPFTQRVRLGIMVCGNTYRNPAFLLKQAMTVDHISGGRVDFGVGAGWVEREHEAYGFEFPSAKERVDRFAEALEIWELLQTEERTTYEGVHYQLLDAPFEPKSVQSPRMPVLVGGSGPRMLRLTARHADIWNCGGTPEEAAATNRRLDEACAAEGRDPATLVRTVSPGINLLESVDAFATGVAAYQAAGFRDIYLPWPRTEAEVPVLREVARDLLPQLQGREPTPTPTRPMQPPLRQLTSDLYPRSFDDWPLPPDPAARLVLDCLIAHPDERLDGQAIVRLTGIERHAEVTRAFVALREHFAAGGMAPPWNEAQRGWLLPREAAEKLVQS